jgi:hypothetical protein
VVGIRKVVVGWERRALGKVGVGKGVGKVGVGKGGSGGQAWKHEDCCHAREWNNKNISCDTISKLGRSQCLVPI